MNLSTWSIHNPIAAFVLFVLLTLGGLLSFRAMKVQNLPDLNIPMITISCELPGAAPAQLDNDVARKIENAVASIQQLKHITTKIHDSTVFITTEFRLEKPVEEAVNDVRSAIAKVKDQLPAELRDPVVAKLDLAGKPILAYTVASTVKDDEALSWFVDDVIIKRLSTLPGIGSVHRVGGVSREVIIELDPVKLQALGSTVAEVSQQLRKIQKDSSAGKTNLGKGEQPIRTLAATASVDDLKLLEIPLSRGRSIRLNHVAVIKDSISEQRSLALLDGKPVVSFEITRSRGASDIEVWSEVQKVLKELVAANADLNINEAYNFVIPIEEEFNGAMSLLYEGAALAIAVVWLFLKDWRATLISAIALPLSVIPAFLGIHLLGFSLNMVTLLAQSIVIGILVDDAIVEVENIVRHLRKGVSPYLAAKQAADEIGLAVIATTFAIIAVFLPTAFMSGIAGQFFKQFGWTAALAVLTSLAVARMLTPMLAAHFLKVSPHHELKQRQSMRFYLQAVAWCLQHRFLTLSIAGGFFLGSVMLIPLLPTGFMPAEDNTQTQVNIELPPGSSLTQTRAIVEEARQLIAEQPYVKSVYTAVGGSVATSDPLAARQYSTDISKASLTVLLAERSARPYRKQIIEQNIRLALQNLPGIRSTVGMGGSGEKFMLILSGTDAETLASVAQNVDKELRTLSGLGSITSSMALTRPEIAIRQNLSRAADLGVTTEAIAETLRIATVGDYEFSLPKLSLSQRQLPVLVKLAADGSKDLAVLERLAVPSNKLSSGLAMLGQVAKLELSSGPTVIDRFDRYRNIRFEIEISSQSLGTVSRQVQNLESIQHLPSGIRLMSEGDAESMDELFSSFGMAMLTGILCIYLVLVLLFKDFLQPITILAALPLCFGGSFVALLLSGNSFSLPSLIGLIMLMGLACKNSILLVEYTLVKQRTELDNRTLALLDACEKRARPIIMTSIAMAAGMLPIALGIGSADPSFRSPMAIAVIGGLVTSTVLSLVIIPVIYSYLDDFKGYFSKLDYANAKRKFI